MVTRSGETFLCVLVSVSNGISLKLSLHLLVPVPIADWEGPLCMARAPSTKMTNWWVWAEKIAACLIRCWWLGRTFPLFLFFGWSHSTCCSFLWDLYSLCMQDLFFTFDQNMTGVSLGTTAAEPGNCHLLSKKHLVAVFPYATTKHCRLLCLLLQIQVAFFGLLCSWKTLWQHYTKTLLFELCLLLKGGAEPGPKMTDGMH